MAVKIRLSRAGKKNRPYWRFVAINERNKRDGAYLELFGTYDPLKHQIINLDLERIEAWIAKGAQCSPTVRKHMRVYKKSSQVGQPSAA